MQAMRDAVVRSYITWTPSQREQVQDRMVELLLEHHKNVDLTKTNNGLLDSQLVTNLMRAAQPVLGKDFQKKTFTSKLHHEFVVDVSSKLRQTQLKRAAKEIALDSVPFDKLFAELASRLGLGVSEYVLSRMRKEILDQSAVMIREMTTAALAKELGLIKERLKHNPFGIQDATKPNGLDVPTYTIVGLLPDQEHRLESDFAGRCKFEFVKAEETFRATDASRGRIAFCSRFITDSLYQKVKTVAAHAVKVNGGPSDLRRLVTAQLSDFESLKEQEETSAAKVV